MNSIEHGEASILVIFFPFKCKTRLGSTALVAVFIRNIKMFKTIIAGSESVWEGERVVSILFGTTYGAICKYCGLQLSIFAGSKGGRHNI